LRDDARTLFDSMYGNKPDKWDEKLRGMDRLRFVINAFTRMRYVTRDGRIDLKQKDAPGKQEAGFVPWFDAPGRASRDVRVVCGHWSTLGLERRKGLLALDTGCVWGGALTAVNLDTDGPPVQLPCTRRQLPGGGEG
jgi:bis(5'-nucleosyl)-tetraphosphatase (symmetrical)